MQQGLSVSIRWRRSTAAAGSTPAWTAASVAAVAITIALVGVQQPIINH